MDAYRIKEMFLSQLPEGLAQKLPRLTSQIIDEAIESQLNGHTNFNGRKPENEQEWYIAIGLHLVTATTIVDGMLNGAREASPKEAVTVNINYRGETHTFNYDALEK